MLSLNHAFLCQCGHKRDYIKAQINKAFNVPRQERIKPFILSCPRKDILYYQLKKNQQPYVTAYKSSLPNFNNIIKNIILFLQPSDCCKNTFIYPLLLAYCHPCNLRDTLIRAKVNTPKISPSLPPKITSCNDGRWKTCNS